MYYVVTANITDIYNLYVLITDIKENYQQIAGAVCT